MSINWQSIRCNNVSYSGNKNKTAWRNTIANQEYLNDGWKVNAKKRAGSFLAKICSVFLWRSFVLKKRNSQNSRNSLNRKDSIPTGRKVRNKKFSGKFCHLAGRIIVSTFMRASVSSPPGKGKRRFFHGTSDQDIGNQPRSTSFFPVRSPGDSILVQIF